MAADTITSRAPDARFLLAHPAHFIALGFGSGLAPVAPGTFGTLAGAALYAVLALALPPLAVAFAAVPLFFVGVWACGVTGRDLGVMDHGAMVFDEIVAFLPLAAFAHLVGQKLVSDTHFPAGKLVSDTSFSVLAWVAAAFVLFRLFDIWKPFPIRHFERRLKGGFGVMFDDLVASAYAYAVLIPFAVFFLKRSLSP